MKTAKPKKPQRKIEVRQEAPYTLNDDITWAGVPRNEIISWLMNTPPIHALDPRVLLEYRGDYGEDGAYLALAWFEVVDNPNYDKEMKKYQKQLVKWQKEQSK